MLTFSLSECAASEYTDSQQLQAFTDKAHSHNLPNANLITFDSIFVWLLLFVDFYGIIYL